MDEATQLIFERNPVLCGHFHKALDKVLRELSSRSTIFVLGDFNTKSGSLDDLHPRFVGNYGCSVTNVIGKVLIDLSLLTNTNCALPTLQAPVCSHK